MSRIFEVREVLHQRAGVVVGRTVPQDGGKTFIVKAIDGRALDPTRRAQLRYERRTLVALAATACPEIPQVIDWVENEIEVKLVLEDIGATSLRVLTETNIFSLQETLRVVQTVARTLTAVHQARYVHRDVNPNNIVLNRQSGRLQLIDYGLASRLKRDLQDEGGLRNLEGTLPYLSPEQTGRTQQSIDHRSDLYALGVTFFELVCGRLPFDHADLQDMVYAILATPPPDPGALRPRLPRVVADIILRLLQKEPERRYQSAYGLWHDITTCLTQLAADEDLQPFDLASQDRIEIFELSEKLYGRNSEVAALKNAFTTAQQHSRGQLLLIAGPPGIGKSRLVGTLEPLFLKEKALFGRGKHEEMRRNSPFSSFAQAVGGFVKRTLKEPEEVREQWRRIVQGAVGNLGQALVDIAPDVALLIGQQRPLSELEPRETENRLLSVIERLIRALCERRAVVLFLDDLQWADSGTLKLLPLLDAQAGLAHGLFVICSYRDTEAASSHALHLTLDGMRAAGRELPTLRLGALSIDDVAEMIADSTGAAAAQAAALAVHLHAKSDGNPFFLRALAQHLWDAQLIVYDAREHRFSWQLEAVQQAAIPDNVVSFMMAKVDALPPAAKAALGIAACLGNVVPLNLLAEVAGYDVTSVAARLTAATDAGLLVSSGSAYRYAEDGLVASQMEINYQFAHDRVLEAAYATLPPREREVVHHRAGTCLLRRHLQGTEGRTDIFAVLGHFNRALPQIQSSAERLQICKLNIEGGTEAQKQAAYAAARTFFTTAIELGADTLVKDHLELLRSLYIGLARSEFLDGLFDSAMARLDRFESFCKTPSDFLDVYAMRLVILSGVGRFAEAVSVCNRGLAAVGSRARVTRFRFNISAIVAMALQRNPKEELERAGECTDKTDLMTLALLTIVASCVFRGGLPKSFFVNLVSTMYGISRRSGRSPYVAHAYAGVCVILTSLGQFRRARTYATLALDLAARPDTFRPHTVQFVANAWALFPYMGPLQQEEVKRQGLTMAQNSGDAAFAGWYGLTLLQYRMRRSIPLATELCAQIGNGATTHAARSDIVALQMLLDWLSEKSNSESQILWSEQGDDEAHRYLRAHPGSGTTACTILYLQLWGAYLAGEEAHALRLARELCERKFAAVLGYESVHYAALPTALALVGHIRRVGKAVYERRLLRQVLQHLEAVAKLNPERFSGEPLLIRAEIADLDNKHAEAASHYERACAAMVKNGWQDSLAVVHECAAAFYQRCGLPNVAAYHLRQSRDAYAAWGAVAKVRALTFALAAYVQADLSQTWLVAPSAASASDMALRSTLPRSTTGRDSAFNDAAQAEWFRKFAEALLQPRNQADVASVAVAMIQQKLGATRVVLFRNGPVQLDVVADTAGQSEAMPRDLIVHVAHAQTPLFLRDAADSPVPDAYLSSRALKAALTVPVAWQGRTEAVIYLESTFSSHAFTEEQADIVSLASGCTLLCIRDAEKSARLDAVVDERVAAMRDEFIASMQREKEHTEAQMAGGFAHEMRNALASASFPVPLIATTPDYVDADETPLCDIIERQAETLASLGLVPDAAPVVATIAQSSREIRELMQLVGRGLAQSQNITQQILDYARVSQIVAGADTADLAHVVDQVLQDLQPHLKAAHIDYKISLGSGARVLIREAHAYTIVRNLLANAKDALATTPPTRQRSLAVGVDRQANRFVLRITDTAMGMDAEVKKRIFQPFFTTKGTHGTGLGLGFSRKLAQAYGGSLEFNSRYGEGTTFMVSFQAAEEKPV